MPAFDTTDASAPKLDSNLSSSQAFSQTGGDHALMQQAQQAWSRIKDAGHEMVKNGTLPDIGVILGGHATQTAADSHNPVLHTKTFPQGVKVTSDERGRALKIHSTGDVAFDGLTTTVQYDRQNHVSKLEEKYNSGLRYDWVKQSDGTYAEYKDGKLDGTKYDNVTVDKQGTVQYTDNKDKIVIKEFANQTSITSDYSTGHQQVAETVDANGEVRDYTYAKDGRIERIDDSDLKSTYKDSWVRNTDGTYSDWVDYNGKMQDSSMRKKDMSVDANGTLRETWTDGTVEPRYLDGGLHS